MSRDIDAYQSLEAHAAQLEAKVRALSSQLTELDSQLSLQKEAHAAADLAHTQALAELTAQLTEARKTIARQHELLFSFHAATDPEQHEDICNSIGEEADWCEARFAVLEKQLTEAHQHLRTSLGVPSKEDVRRGVFFHRLPCLIFSENGNRNGRCQCGESKERHEQIAAARSYYSRVTGGQL